MLYHLNDIRQAACAPLHLMAGTARSALGHPMNGMALTQLGRSMAGGAEIMERLTRRFGKPCFNLGSTQIAGQSYDVEESIEASLPFCRLIRFRRTERATGLPRTGDPKLLLVAPLSGHHATLLRGTVEALLPGHDVYVTDWLDASTVPVSKGRFDLEDFIGYLLSFMRQLGPDTHVMAVWQPTVPVLAAVSILAAANDPCQPRSMILMGGPVDTAASPTVVTRLADEHTLKWFERTLIETVPIWHAGACRRVYPGFLQLTGFMSMNLDRHINAHVKMFEHLIRGDGECAEQSKKFYDEYLSVLDLTAEFYLQTVERVFQKRSLATGTMTWRGNTVDPGCIERTALLTVEGELDDISAPGQTYAAHRPCSALPSAMKDHYLQEGVGHYGVFNGRKWRERILPRIAAFILTHEHGSGAPARQDSPKAA
jgi:poly(3-hydroxybutyrate) depolymerase